LIKNPHTTQSRTALVRIGILAPHNSADIASIAPDNPGKTLFSGLTPTLVHWHAICSLVMQDTPTDYAVAPYHIIEGLSIEP
jgi:hypothetical protein